MTDIRARALDVTMQMANNEKEFMKKSRNYENGELDETEYNEELQTADVELRQVEAQLEEFTELVSRLEKYLGQGGFNDTLVRELIESIQISQNNGVEIRFVCEDIIQQITEMGEEVAS